MLFPNPEGARSELHELISAVPNLSAPSTSKFSQVEIWLAGALQTEVDSVYAVWVSKPGNLSVRLEQRGRPTRVGFAILKSHEDLPGCLRAGQRKVGPGRPCTEALVLCSRPTNSRWTVSAVIRSPESKATAPIEAVFSDLGIVEPLVEPGMAAPPSDSLDGLADELFVDRTWLHEVAWLLHDKRGVVFYGPPGTGKTFIALKLAEHLQADERLRRLVQLHPSYGYEDFFEGYRPSMLAGESMALELRHGPLRELCDAALSRPEEAAVLVLDEMNRGNLPRVFGELYFALEYRRERVGLMYSPDGGFQLPENLLLLGTMNTADRSIALLDQALRRRFHFVSLFPGESVVDGMLSRYLEAHHRELLWLADVLAEANERLGDRNVAIGPSHFMRDDLDERIISRIWRHSVLPTIQEHFFGEDDRLADYQLDALREAVTADAADDE